MRRPSLFASLRFRCGEADVFAALRLDVAVAARALVPYDRGALLSEVERVTSAFGSGRVLADRQHVWETARQLLHSSDDAEMTVAALGGVLYRQRTRRRSEPLRRFIVSETEHSAGRAYGVHELMYLRHRGGSSIEGAEMAMLLCGAHSLLLMQMLGKELNARGLRHCEHPLEAAYGVSKTLVIASQAAKLETQERGHLFRMMLPDWHGDVASLVATVRTLLDSGGSNGAAAP